MKKTFTGEFIEDQNCVTPHENIETCYLRDDINCLLATLQAREEQVLRRRSELMTISDIEEVGHEFEVTRERIRQLKPKPFVNCVIHPVLTTCLFRVNQYGKTWEIIRIC